MPVLKIVRVKSFTEYYGRVEPSFRLKRARRTVEGEPSSRWKWAILTIELEPLPRQFWASRTIETGPSFRWIWATFTVKVSHLKREGRETPLSMN